MASRMIYLVSTNPQGVKPTMTMEQIQTTITSNAQPALWEASGTITLPSSRSLLARFLYLGEDNYVLGAQDLLPIRVKISLDDVGSYVVTSPDTGIFGVARTLTNALRDFRSALQEHYEVLEEDEANLAP